MLQAPIAVLPGTLVEEDVMNDAVEIPHITSSFFAAYVMLPMALAKEIMLKTIEMRKRGLSACFGL
jgi:hypothetical protein